ncbi:phytanoyl-CoA dioxygenase family protein [Streptomyces rimosus]|uniref:phytanoyl-CoA dioxygenase family protein n=1 Tax=Streptomyces rimosus TaxID=1927 RepID=UPI0004C4F563|nr:phytanoyl-CoA dioxygenase family protein [Streptomyces rimosus]
MSGRNGPLGPKGLREIHWGDPVAAAHTVLDEHLGPRTEISRNPHRSQAWAKDLVRAPGLLEPVQEAIGPNVAVENTFLVIKWPGEDFEVPWHQDGIDDRIELDPQRSVSAWLALTNAPPGSGCLYVVPCSQRRGYLPYHLEDDTGAGRGRAQAADVPDGLVGTPLTCMAGQGVLMDVRLLHRSGSNRVRGVRIGLNIRYVAPGGIQTLDGSTPKLDPVSGTGW